MRFPVLCVLAVAAVARADYHDNVFHFSTVQRPTAFRSQYQQPSAAYITKYSQPASAQYYQSANTQFYQPAATQYFQPATAYRREYYEQPAVVNTAYAQPQALLQTPFVYNAPSVYQAPVTTAFQPQLNGISSYASSFSGPQYRILKHTQEVDPSGPYRAHYQTENGITNTEEGALTVGSEGPAVAKKGSYSYTGPDGRQYSVNWVADEFGFRAAGDHLPTPPSVPSSVYKK
ncbi:endocuticle structural glycoprotein SgAbd-1-like isoform X2 [Frankliniella occidentalis]|uniref:Endocuticle structural glycoprotein SgAbd-1-like isoform X2 n=1 Tax=Frankliniella occidentalis TaxID=133901 RepID=A0A9C6XQW3_FRAOC|nr:endocuticle structural glycoprotein SgAbd-1-like isoform X2 [Frankliniella occidentalis]